MTIAATNAPVKRARNKEGQYTGDIKIQQKPDINLNAPEPRTPDLIQLVDKPLTDEYLQALAFAEEPVHILIPRSSDKDVTRFTDLVSLNGIWAEVLFKNGWVPIGYLPRGVSFTTKRKYVEVLARSKQDNVQTSVVQQEGEDPQNFVQRFTSAKTPFQVIEDKNPKAGEWLSRIVSSQA